MSRNKKVLVPGAKSALDAMKYELAAEIGIVPSASYDFNSEFAGELGVSEAPSSVNWRAVSTRNVGYIGGSITKRLIQQAEATLGKL